LPHFIRNDGGVQTNEKILFGSKVIMGQKVNPIGMRVGITKSRPCEWFNKTKRTGTDFFVEDIKIRNFIEKTFPRSGISKVVVRKTAKEGEIIIFTSKIGVLM